MTAMRGPAPHFIQIHADILAKYWTVAASYTVTIGTPKGDRTHVFALLWRKLLQLNRTCLAAKRGRFAGRGLATEKN